MAFDREYSLVNASPFQGGTSCGYRVSLIKNAKTSTSTNPIPGPTAVMGNGDDADSIVSKLAN